MESPAARDSELREVLRLLGNQTGNTIVEIGAGHGFLTSRLYDLVGPAGKIIAVDNSEQQVARLREHFPQVSSLRAPCELLPIKDETADTIVSLANFHHMADKNRAFQECARILRPGGKLILADVSAGTPLQRYFDEVVDRICSTGHQHTFLDKALCRRLCDDARLELLTWELKSVPWHFPSAGAGGLFLKLLHDASWPADQCWQAVSSYLRTSNESGQVLLHWELFFMIARKCDNQKTA
jgi:SAM-dependent methyltransferase